MKQLLKNLTFEGSQAYWEKRYANGGDSGNGSKGEFNKLKADTINGFIKKNRIGTVIDWGCGDGNFVELIDKDVSYNGVDVSKTAVQKCKERFSKDAKKVFMEMRESGKIGLCDLSFSLDVLFHLTERKVFESYLERVFSSSDKWVIIYSTNYDAHQQFHEKRRNFTGYVESKYTDWKLVEIIDNRLGEQYPSFYIYRRDWNEY